MRYGWQYISAELRKDRSGLDADFPQGVLDLLISTWNGHETIRSGEAVARCGRASVL